MKKQIFLKNIQRQNFRKIFWRVIVQDHFMKSGSFVVKYKQIGGCWRFLRTWRTQESAGCLRSKSLPYLMFRFYPVYYFTYQSQLIALGQWGISSIKTQMLGGMLSMPQHFTDLTVWKGKTRLDWYPTSLSPLLKSFSSSFSEVHPLIYSFIHLFIHLFILPFFFTDFIFLLINKRAHPCHTCVVPGYILFLDLCNLWFSF